ncbi:probable purine permease 13 isoform X1 [Eutrema salsugineum]|uniref:probable purine permease 13 isoform X1 n=1 Tax=Eutrema salsugineum TaxID=72664 RepID=UPI000CED125F|nr:probable purine permease 13 isoform X1 [Eutrema salsugineum]
MDVEELMLIKEEDEGSSQVRPQLMKLKRSQWWLFVFISIFFLISAQAVAVLLGRFYYNEGGNSKWISTLVQTVGFPILYLPLCLLPASHSSSSSCCFKTLFWIYLSLGLAIGLDNLLYSYGLLLLSASAYSLICVTQLVFNAIFSCFINSQKISLLIGISVSLLTISAGMIALDDDSESPSGGSKWSYLIGVWLTLLASLIYSLQLSLMQYSFEEIIKKETFGMVIEMQIYTSLVASIVSVIGLFASGEWKMLTTEMEEFHKGQVMYVLTLVGTAISWQLGSVGAVALIFLVSSLFSNLIGTLSLVVTPLAAILVFHDKLTEGKIVAMLMAFLGVALYMYQNYLDDLKVQSSRETQAH